VESQVIKMHEDTELGGVGLQAHISTHCQPLCRCSSTATGRAIEQSRFGSPQGQRFVVNAVQIGAGPSYSVRTWGSPPWRYGSRVVKLTTTLHTLTLGISGANLFASRLRGWRSQWHWQAYLVCRPKACALDRTFPEDGSKHVTTLRMPALTPSRNRAVPALI